MAAIDAGEIERICELLGGMSERCDTRDISRDLTFRFRTLDDALAVRVALDGRWDRDSIDSTATQAAFRVNGMTVTLFCPEMKACRDHVGRGVGTLREGKDFARPYVFQGEH